MHLFGKDLTRDVAVIAEIGVNHEGDLDAALRLVALAAEAGADAVKFQTYTPSRFIAADDAERLTRVGRFDLGEAGFRQLAAEAERRGVAFFSTPVTEDVVPFLDTLCPVFKIASGDLTFEPVIRAAAATGKPVLLSTGLGTVAEIDRAVGWIREEIGGAPLAERLILLQCVSAYPTPIEQANVLSVPFLAGRHGVTVGYSNHVAGRVEATAACLAAVAQGAAALEVHVTDRREGKVFRDHHLSFEPAELADLVALASATRRALGVFGKERQPCEIAGLAAMRKGVVAARPLTAGTRLTRDDLMWARPASGFPADALPDLIGRRLAVALDTGQSLQPGHLSPRSAPDDGENGGRVPHVG